MGGRASRTLTVRQKKYLTPNMIRMVLGGDELSDFPLNEEGGYIKLSFPAESTDFAVASQTPSKPLVRSYTIRAFDHEALELTLDFVVHDVKGPASTWALVADQGDTIHTNGPGVVKRVDTQADWVFIAGDMTALPAISVNIDTLPSSAKGYVVIEILDEKDKQSFHAPEGIHVHWVINPHPEIPNTLLFEAVKKQPWLAGNPSIWFAGEFDAMRHMRRYFKQERCVARDQIYLSSYWKMGDTDEGNKAAKKRDAALMNL